VWVLGSFDSWRISNGSGSVLNTKRKIPEKLSGETIHFFDLRGTFWSENRCPTVTCAKWSFLGQKVDFGDRNQISPMAHFAEMGARNTRKIHEKTIFKTV
jgi:hypothetical protein